MSRPLDWDSDGRDWPHREASRFVAAGSLTWHVQEMGSGPALVLLHGTGAATHSWRHLMPLLAQHNRVIAMDLPGHGFTRGRPAGGLTLPGMAAAVATLLQKLEVQPERLIGHSAGAAIALRMVRDGFAVPEVIGLNAALSPFPGFFAPLFQGLARALVLNPLVPRLFAASARTSGDTGRLLVRSTGSNIDAEGVRSYAMLLGNALHCRGALEMMAGWDLAGLQRDLPKVMAQVRLIHGAKDAAVPVGSVEQAVKLMPQATLEVLAGLGHLAHEERADLVAEAMAAAAAVHA
ncbi:alpha/beta fold hydrolase BchO [Novosphingobium sp. AAP93]|uniref:alpha/beta fold hydrolase BchO n=1 Tax=Novosphingobium sp. AAP93 TaxID=1523427 RepID=UPI0006B9E85E|nr:alpha/beta fold hydrolase BchO [Novosphingobium sp. AAP93]KPF79551.1 alpha/beta hydrolase [Novosphingobium sp. AAP93]